MKRYLNLLDRFALIANQSPESFVGHVMPLLQSHGMPRIRLAYATRTFVNPFEALEALPPFEHGRSPNRVLFLRGRNGTWCVLTNAYPTSAFNFCCMAKQHGFDALGVHYRTRPWHYYVELHTTAGLRRRLVSEPDNWADSPAPLDLEDLAVLKKLKRHRPVGRREIAKFCHLFGWPLPVSRDGLDFITESILYDITPMPNNTWVDAETASLITVVPPSWISDEDVLADPEPDPEYTKREAFRRKWNRFRRVLTAALKEKLGPTRRVLVLPQDGIERHSGPGDAWIELIAPDDAMRLKDLEDRVIGDAMAAGSFFADVEVHGLDPHGNVFAVLELTSKPPGEAQEWRIGFAPEAEVRISAYTQDPEQGRERQLVDVQSLYG